MKPTCETLVPIAADIPIKEKRSLEKERGEHLPARERERERERKVEKRRNRYKKSGRINSRGCTLVKGDVGVRLA